MPDLDGPQVMTALRRDDIEVGVLFLSAGTDGGTSYGVVADGARGYLSKKAGRQEICEAISRVARGETVLAAEVQSGLASEIGRRQVALRRPRAHRARARDPQAGRRGPLGPRHRARDPSQPDDRQGPPAHALREAGGLRPRRRGGGGDAQGAARIAAAAKTGGDPGAPGPGQERRGTGRRSEDLERETLELVVEQMRDSAIFALDLDGVVLTWNRGAERIFGYPREEIVGRGYDVFFPDADRVSGRPGLILDAARMRGAHQDEAPRVRSDGTTFWAEVVTTALLHSDGTPRAYSNRVRDITERRRAEEQLSKRAAEVAQLADERARLVLQLLDAEQRERRRVSQALHDDALQNLIAAFDELSAANGGSATHEEACRRIAPLLERTIDQLRDTALELHPLLLERKGLLVALDAIARGAAGLGGFRVSVRVDPGAASVNDRMVLSVARELLVNAAKHSKASRVSVVAQPSDGGVDLTVSDDGVGLSAERREEALGEGHIGLASLAERLSAIGGELSLASPGEGTVATAAIPADPSAGE